MQNTHFVFSNFFSPQTYRLSYSVGGKNVVDTDRP